MEKKLKSEDKEKEKKEKNENLFASCDFLHFFWNRSKNRKEYKQLIQENVNVAVKYILEGLGGEKNLFRVKCTTYSVKVWVKSGYFIQKEILDKSGGMGIRVSEKYFSAVFDKHEAKQIARNLKESMWNTADKYRLLDIE